jgi:hypothetical protein
MQERNFEADLRKAQWKNSNHFALLGVGPLGTEKCRIGGGMENNPGIFFDGAGGVEFP